MASDQPQQDRGMPTPGDPNGPWTFTFAPMSHEEAMAKLRRAGAVTGTVFGRIRCEEDGQIRITDLAVLDGIRL